VDLKPTAGMAELAARGLALREEHGRGGTEVGVARARDISNRANLSPKTVGRMANFFSRHRVDLDAPAAKPGHDDYPSAGVVAWLLWGGDPANPDEAGAAWADRKLDELEGARGKAEGDRVSSTPAKPSEQREGSDENPEGSASGSRGGIEISDEQEKGLKNKVEEHNEEHGEKKGKKVDLGMLKAVYRRGAGAFSTSHRPGITRQQWSMARVNAFLYLVRNGRPKNAKYVGDNDLLPKGHPKKEDKKAKWLDWEMPGCKCKNHAAKVYEWPEETKWHRLAIEGLAADYDRLRPKAATDEPDADDDIRSGERRTPAMSIAVVVQEGLESVRKRIIQGLESGEIGPEGQKSAGDALESDHHRRIVRAVLADLVGARGKMLDDLTEAITSAARSGGSVGTARVNEILGVAGAERISTPALSAALEKAIAGRASLIVASVIDATVTDAIGSLGGDFSISKEVERLQTGYGFSVDRAETIARTESANAYHEGQVDTWKEAGVVKGKHFLVAPGACEFCKTIEKRFGAAGKSLEVDAPMVRGGETIQGADGGTFRPKFDSQGIVHPNCRCDFMPVLEDL